MKKLIVILLVLLNCWAYGQQMDTIFTKAGGKIICKVMSMNDFNVKYLLYTKDDTLKGKIDADKVVRVGLYANKTLNVEPVTYVSQYKPETVKQDSPAIDTLKYLMSQNAYLKSKLSDFNVNIIGLNDRAKIAGNRIRNAGIFGISSIVAGAVSGVLFSEASKWGNKTDKSSEWMDYYAKKANTYNIFGLACGIISGICYIAVPIELICGGVPLRNK
jgi:hypothetical protein